MLLPQGQALGIALFKFGHGPRAQRIGPHFVNHGLVLLVTGASGGPSSTAPPAPTWLPRSQCFSARRAVLWCLSPVYRVCPRWTQLHSPGETHLSLARNEVSVHWCLRGDSSDGQNEQIPITDQRAPLNKKVRFRSGRALLPPHQPLY